MKLPTIAEVDIAEKRVFIRVNFDVPLNKDGVVLNRNKIISVLPTIKYAVAQNAKVIIGSSLGNARGKYNKKYSLDCVGSVLSELLNTEIFFPDNSIGEAVKKIGTDMQPGQIMLLENLEFQKGEVENNSEFAKRLSECADIYVNEAFSLSNKVCASLNSILEYFEDICVGFQFKKEIESLDRIRDPERPFVAVFGGSDVQEKVDLMESMLDNVDTVLVGGMVANSFIKVLGGEIGKSSIDDKAIYSIKRFISSAETRNIRVILPQDVVAIDGHLNNYSSSFIISGGRIPEDIRVVDIGPEAQADFESKLAQAKTIFWTGPLGICEDPEFRAGTESLVKALDNTDSFNVVVGQDSVDIALESGQNEGRSFMSQGGKASFDYIMSNKLSALQAMEEKIK